MIIRLARRTAVLVTVALVVTGGYLACVFDIPATLVADGAVSDATADVDITCTCGAPAPPGWNGPFVLSESTEPARCPAGSTTVPLGGADLAPAPAQCSPCTCVPPPADGGCPPYTYVHISDYDGGGCMGDYCGGAYAHLGQCNNTYAICNSHAVDQPLGWKCTPNGGQATLPEAGFRRFAVGCAPDSAGCANGMVCVPSKPCIARAGEVACPMPFTQKTSYFSFVMDSRGCTPCACGPSICNATVTLYPQQNCLGTPQTISLPAQAGCQTGPTPLSVKVTSLSPGPCEAEGGTPTGTVTPSGPITVCCVP